jgi:hypothetical protein
MDATNAAYCTYDERFVHVLTVYKLPVIAADKTGMNTVLTPCGTVDLTAPLGVKQLATERCR